MTLFEPKSLVRQFRIPSTELHYLLKNSSYFWGILVYHRFVFLPFFTVFWISSLMYFHLFPKSHLLCNRCICVPVYKYSTVSEENIGKSWGKGGHNLQTLNPEMCSVPQGQRSLEEAPSETPNLVLHCWIPSHLFSPSTFSLSKIRMFGVMEDHLGKTSRARSIILWWYYSKQEA